MNKHIRPLLLPLAMMACTAAQARVLMIISQTEEIEIPRSQIKTYIQKGTLQGNLKSIKAVKPGAYSDEELATIPERYLPAELVQKQRSIKARMRQSDALRPKKLSRKEDVVTIGRGENKTYKLKIDEAIYIPPRARSAGILLAPQKRLPEVELLQEVKVKSSEKIRAELEPGDPREMHVLFDYGRTSEEARRPLLPAYAAYADKDYATAVTLALAIMSTRSSAETSDTARFLAAHSLFQAGFYSTAMPFVVELVDSKWRRSALGIAAKIIEKTRDDSSANQILTKISLSQITENLRPLFSFHLGRVLLGSGAAGAALAAFDKVPSEHLRYPEAQYYMGVIQSSELGSNIGEADWNREGSPVYVTRMHFEQAVVGGRSSDAKDLKNLAALSLARLAYQGRQYNQAIYYYQSVDSASPFSREAIFETAWSLYRLGEFNRALGTLHPLGGPYYEGKDFPELWILRSLNYLKLCRFDEAQKAANTFEQWSRDLMPTLRDASRNIGSLSLDKPSDLERAALPPWLRTIVLADPVVRKDRTREDLLLEEGRRLAVLRKNERVRSSDLRNSAADTLQVTLDKKLRALGVALRPYVQNRVEDLASEYKSQRERLDFLRFEIYSQANRFPGALDRPEAKKLIAKNQFLPGVFLKGHEILWRFSGEYWFDELRGYDYFIPTECKSEEM